MGPKIENVGFSLVLPLLFEGSRWPGRFQENERPAGKCLLGGGKGEGKPSPKEICLEVLGGLEGLLDGSGHLHA